MSDACIADDSTECWGADCVEDQERWEREQGWHDEFDEDPDSDPMECCLGSACLNPHPYHFASECFDLEMAESSMSYAEQDGKR